MKVQIVKRMTKRQIIHVLRTCADGECRSCMLYKLCLENNDAANEMLRRAADLLEAKSDRSP